MPTVTVTVAGRLHELTVTSEGESPSPSETQPQHVYQVSTAAGRLLGTVTRYRHHRGGGVYTAWRYDVDSPIVTAAADARDAKCDHVVRTEHLQSIRSSSRYPSTRRSDALQNLVGAVRALDDFAAAGCETPDPTATVTVTLTVALARLQLNLNRATLREHPFSQGDGRTHILEINAMLEKIIADAPRAAG